MPDLLFELFSEEIPARMQERAADDLARLVTAGLKDAGLSHGEAWSFVTPRRLTLNVKGLPDAQPDVSEERKGPNVNAPEKALAGFRGSLPEGARVEERDMPKGRFFFAIIDRKGRPTVDVLTEVLESALAAFPWPKSMRWGSGSTRWVRPLHSILALFGETIVPVNFAGVTSGRTTRGHRFLAPEPFEVASFADYEEKLKAAYVRLDTAERKAVIIDGLLALTGEVPGVSLKMDDGLLAEVAGLVEWPVPLMGTIDDAFMDVPDEVLITSMKSHQKYFSCLKDDGRLANKFVVVANTEAADDNAEVIAGNERVLRARLSDAKFFWDQDRKQSLESRVPALAERIFHAKLGTDLERVERIGKLAVALAAFVPGADSGKVARAARLAKADLTTEMVGEFPELQGLMGRYYAGHDGEDKDVADAIAQHYSPQGPGDDCPTAPTAVCVALADKLDTLVGFWSIDEKPTGSKDPYALRRAALGVIRLITENGLRLCLNEAVKTAGAGYDGADVAEALLPFFADRLKVQQKEKGTRHDLIEAVFALGDEDDLVRLLARVEALTTFLGSDDGANLLAAYKRAANIVRAEEKKDKTTFAAKVDESLLSQAEEKAVFEGLNRAEAQISAALEGEDFTGAMAALSPLRAPLDAFFDAVTVNAEDKAVRLNRLGLLARIPAALKRVADFSKIGD
ncbi:MAG: glycine--tRNA ligase subunit beta [Magnetovibrionaceae bacterium]